MPWVEDGKRPMLDMGGRGGTLEGWGGRETVRSEKAREANASQQKIQRKRNRKIVPFLQLNKPHITF